MPSWFIAGLLTIITIDHVLPHDYSLQMGGRCITQFTKMSIDPKLVEPTVDVNSYFIDWKPTNVHTSNVMSLLDPVQLWYSNIMLRGDPSLC